jgi:hypothetical protein
MNGNVKVCEWCGSDKDVNLYEHRYLATLHYYCSNCNPFKLHFYLRKESKMEEQEFREHLMKVKELSDEMDRHLKKLLDAVEIDGRFIKQLPNHKIEEGELIPKWEKRSVVCLWGENRNFNMNIHRHCDEMMRK